MKALIQRVRRATVDVDDARVGEIGPGLLVFLGVEKGDDATKCARLAERVLNYRIFADDAGKMNRSVKDMAGGVLVVSQFTLAADTGGGNRPSFTPAAVPTEGRLFYEQFVEVVRQQLGSCETGRFGADMQVALINDGPVTFLLSI